MAMTLCFNRPYEPLPPVLDSPDSAAYEWRDVLRWCFFLEKPPSEMLAGCGYDYVYFPRGLTPHRLREKGVQTLVHREISSRAKSSV